MATGTELAALFEQSNADMITAVEKLNDEQWMKPSPEGWTVGVAAHHVAESQGALTGMVTAIATGQTLPPFTMEMLNQGNAEHAQRASGCTRDETLQLLKETGEKAADMLRGLTDEQLARTTPMPLMGGTEMSAEQVVEGILLGHIAGHLDGVKAAAGD